MVSGQPARGAVGVTGTAISEGAVRLMLSAWTMHTGRVGLDRSIVAQ